MHALDQFFCEENTAAYPDESSTMDIRHFVYLAISSKWLFVEVSFCRMSTSSKQVFVEYFQRNILCSPGCHIVSADPVTMYHVIVRLRTLGKITDLKLTTVSIKVLVNETRG